MQGDAARLTGGERIGDAGDRGDRLLEQHEHARRAEGFEDVRELGGAAVAEADAHGQVRPERRELARADRGVRHFAYSVERDSRITVILIWPGYSRLSSISRAIWCDSSTAASSSISVGFTITRTSRPACIA